MAWIRIVPPAEATGRLKEEYERAAKLRGALANIHTITSLHPGVLECNISLYQEIQFGDSPLSRRERELVATIVSRENKCGYCLAHHADAFGRHAREPGLQAQVMTDYTKANLSARERALADHAVKLTREPGSVAPEDIEKLRAAGLDDRGILDLTLVIAYFNLMTRLATGLGLSAEDVAERFNY